MVGAKITPPIITSNKIALLNHIDHSKTKNTTFETTWHDVKGWGYTNCMYTLLFKQYCSVTIECFAKSKKWLS